MSVPIVAKDKSLQMTKPSRGLMENLNNAEGDRRMERTHTKTQQLGLRDLSFLKCLDNKTLEASESHLFAVVTHPEVKPEPSLRSRTVRQCRM